MLLKEPRRQVVPFSICGSGLVKVGGRDLQDNQCHRFRTSLFQSKEGRGTTKEVSYGELERRQKRSQHKTPSSRVTMSLTSIPVETGQKHVQNKNSQNRTNKKDRVFHRRPVAESAVGKTFNQNTNSCSLVSAASGVSPFMAAQGY